MRPSPKAPTDDPGIAQPPARRAAAVARALRIARALAAQRLVQFAVIGAAIFAVAPPAPADRAIELRRDAIAALFVADAKRGTSITSERASEIEERLIEDEILYREGVRLGFDRDDGIVRGFAAMGHAMTREQFAVRTDDQVTYGRLVAEGAGIGFIARYQLALWPDVVPLLPALKVPSLPCWLVVHREIRGNPVVRRVYDALAQALPPLLAAGA